MDDVARVERLAEALCEAVRTRRLRRIGELGPDETAPRGVPWAEQDESVRRPWLEAADALIDSIDAVGANPTFWHGGEPAVEVDDMVALLTERLMPKAPA